MPLPLIGLAGFVLKAIPFAKGLLGEGLVEGWLSHKRKLAESANEQEKIRLDAEIRMGEHELSLRAMARDLQLKEYEHPVLWWGKFLLLLSVGMYWAARFQVKTWGLDDFGVAIKELTVTEASVSGMVLAYWFLEKKVDRVLDRVLPKR